jgi:hypothetical protein
MLKATTPFVVLILSYFAGLQQLTSVLVVNVVGVVGGVIVASYGEINFVFSGFLFQIIGIIVEGSRLVLMQKLMKEKMDPLSMMYFLAPVCFTLNSFFFIIYELPTMPFGLWHSLSNLGPLVLLTNAAAAFALNIALVLLIGCTSSLILTLCGVLKDIILICLSMVIFKAEISVVQAFGYSVALFFLVRYKTMNMDWRKEYERIISRPGKETKDLPI